MESPIHQMTQMYPDNNMNVNTTNNELDQRASNKKMKKVKDHFFKGLQLIHFLIVMAYLWAGLVEFINNPPFFDAYGDAISENRLPEGIFQVNSDLQNFSLMYGFLLCFRCQFLLHLFLFLVIE